jgi:hypothetical protein
MVTPPDSSDAPVEALSAMLGALSEHARPECASLSLVRGERFLLSRAARLYETVYEMISQSDVFGG